MLRQPKYINLFLIRVSSGNSDAHAIKTGSCILFQDFEDEIKQENDLLGPYDKSAVFN